jgi:hypothetical protein
MYEPYLEVLNAPLEWAGEQRAEVAEMGQNELLVVVASSSNRA